MLYNISLFWIWLLMLGEISIFSTILGAGIVILVLITSYYMKLRNPVLFNGKINIYILWLVKEIWCSAIAVVKVIWSPKMNINAGFEEIRTVQSTEWGKVLYANSITLTPGTFTLNIEDDRLLVHSLIKQDIWSDEMDNKIIKTIKS